MMIFDMTSTNISEKAQFFALGLDLQSLMRCEVLFIF